MSLNKKILIGCCIAAITLMIFGINNISTAAIKAERAGFAVSRIRGSKDYDSAFDPVFNINKTTGSILSWIGGAGIILSVYGFIKTKE